MRGYVSLGNFMGFASVIQTQRDRYLLKLLSTRLAYLDD